MKKCSIIIILSIILSFFCVNVKAEDTSDYQVIRTASGVTYEFETKSGDLLQVKKKVGSYEYRCYVSGGKYLGLDFRHKRISFLKFLESTTYYVFYGAVYKDYDNDSSITVPYVARIKKDFSKIEIIYDTREEVKGMAHFFNMIEFKADCLYVTEFYKGEYSFGTYEGLYRINKIDENFELINSLDCGETECYISIAYDCLDIKNASGNHLYVDEDFNVLETYKREETYIGYLELEENLYVDDIYYEIGSILSEPGIYFLDDEVHDKKKVIIEPIVTLSGNKDGEYFDGYVEYKVSGGIIKINNEPSYLNGIVSAPGNYTLLITGRNGYIKEVKFSILPELLSTISDGGTLRIGDTIEFLGEAKLNDTIISSGYILKESGTYTLKLMIEDNVFETIMFTVPSEVVTKKSKTWIYIVMSSIVLMLSGVIVYTVIKERKTKKNNI